MDNTKIEKNKINANTSFILVGFIILLLSFVFFKNAWVSDDSYIIFRSVEQFHAGNGPNWNSGQRVQSFTSPLWFALLVFIRFFTSDAFFGQFFLSMVIFSILLVVLYNSFKPKAFLSLGLLLIVSNGFFDYTSSGLENILVYLISSIFILKSINYDARAHEGGANGDFWKAIILWSLLPICRLDLVSLFFFPLIALLFVRKSSGKSIIKPIIVAVFPTFIWSCFSLLYYGALFPNTAYAKLNTGIARMDLVNQGLQYFIVTFRADPITILIPFVAIFLLWKANTAFSKALSVGIVFNFLYILSVGGDFMRGRFFSFSYLAAAIALVCFYKSFFSGEVCGKYFCLNSLLIFLTIFSITFPFTPLNTGLEHRNFNLDSGIADERGYYFDVCSLYAYLYNDKNKVFPDFEWSQIGAQIASVGVKYLENDFNGMLGYWAGTKPLIIDRMGLSDPFLARIPISSKKGWRVGHYKRKVPVEYRNSIQTGKNMFNDGKYSELYRLVSLAAFEDKFFSIERLKAIVKLNLGKY